MKFIKEVRAYVGGAKRVLPLHGVSNAYGTVLEVVLEDDRTVQFSVNGDGAIMLRGWGNVPMLLGNAAQVSVVLNLSPENPTCDENGNRLPVGSAT